MSWEAGAGGGDWNSGPATNDKFTSQDARSGFDNSDDSKATNGYGDNNGYGNTNDADGGHGGGNDGACFSCGEQGQDFFQSLHLMSLTTFTTQPHEVRMPKPSCCRCE
jgi:hypothetical protein